jgi:membrane-associated phospholipid phosphatase
MRFDQRLLLIARTRGHRPGLERALGVYSRLGEHGACWLALGGAGVVLDPDLQRNVRWWRGVKVIAAAYMLNQMVKVVVRRRRPRLPGLPPLSPTITQLSFPSAHATTSFAAALAFSPLAPPPALYVAAMVSGFSRAYLGVHYPSDVLAGALLGTTVALAWPRAEAGGAGCP